MFYIDFDPEAATEATEAWLGNTSDELGNAIGAFYSQLDEIFQKINSYFM